MNILSIQSHVAYGHVGNAAATFPMQRLGHEVWAIHTVQFSNHTGYGAWTGRVYRRRGDRRGGGRASRTRGVLAGCDGVLSGYMGSADIGQADPRGCRAGASGQSGRRSIAAIPVIGDVGRGVFVRPGIPEFMRDRAVPAADIVTPNQFELEYLAGRSRRDDLRMRRPRSRRSGASVPRTVLVTSLADRRDAGGRGGSPGRRRRRRPGWSAPPVSISTSTARAMPIAALFFVHLLDTGSVREALGARRLVGLRAPEANGGGGVARDPPRRRAGGIRPADLDLSGRAGLIAAPRRNRPMQRRFVTLDVFTDRPFAGNPLAVVLDSEGLDDSAMQRIAREFNVSETVFVWPPEDARHRASLRIFTPIRELPFAGHPTVGTAILLALHHATGADAQAFGLEERIGTVPCVVETRGEASGHARFRLPVLPEALEDAPDAMLAAWGLGLDPAVVGFDRHVPSRHSAGVPYDFVPVSSLEVLAQAKPAGEAFFKAFGGNHPASYVYARQTIGHGHRFRARMFAPGMGIAEDPATGSAAAAFAGVLMQCEPLGDGEHAIVVEQGYEMGRPSEIELQIVIRGGALVSAEIGGSAVVVSEGNIRT